MHTYHDATSAKIVSEHDVDVIIQGISCPYASEHSWETRISVAEWHMRIVGICVKKLHAHENYVMLVLTSSREMFVIKQRTGSRASF